MQRSIKIVAAAFLVYIYTISFAFAPADAQTLSPPPSPLATSSVHGLVIPGTGCSITTPGTIDCSAGSSVSLSASTADLIFSPNPITGTGTIGSTSPLNLQSGGNYTVLTGDAAYTILTGAHTYTLPQAGAAGFASGWGTCFLNIAGSGDSTINTTTSIFKGAGGGASLTLTPGAWACPSSDGTDWDTLSGGVVSTLSWPLTAPDNAIAIRASDATSGFAFDTAGLPGLVDGGSGITARLLSIVDDYAGGPGFLISGTTPTLSLSPGTGQTGSPEFDMIGYGAGAVIVPIRYNGSRGATSALVSGNKILELTSSGSFDTGVNDLSEVFSIIVDAAEDFTSGNTGTRARFRTTKIGSSSLEDRIVLDGTPAINLINAGGVVGAPTGGSQGAGTINAEIKYVINGGGVLKENVSFPGSIILQAIDDLGSGVPSVLIKGSNAPAASGHVGSPARVEAGDGDGVSSLGGGLILSGGQGGGSSTIDQDSSVSIHGGDAYAGSGSQGGNIYLSPGTSDPSGFGGVVFVNFPTTSGTPNSFWNDHSTVVMSGATPGVASCTVAVALATITIIGGRVTALTGC